MLVSTGVMSNISPQKNARTPEQNISLRNLCINFWLEETAILDMQMSKLPMISGYELSRVTKMIQNTGKKIEVCETDKSGNQQPKLKQVFPERSRHRTLKYFAEKLQQPEFQAKITGIKQQ